MEKPKRDDILDLKIADIGFEGNGIGKTDSGFVVFVPGVVPGDTVKVRVRKVKKNLAEAKLLEIIDKSQYRIQPECIHFGVCNGCKMQHIDYDYQLNIKRQNVINSLERIGGFAGINVPELLGSDNIYFYRNKLEFSFSSDRWLTESDMENENADKNFALGYHMPGFNEKVIDIFDCRLESEVSNKILNLTRDFFKSRNETIYSTKTHSGYLRYLVIRQAANTSDLMLNLITSSENENLITEYAQQIKQNIPEVTTFINSISGSKAQVAQSDYSIIIFGDGFINEMIGKYKFKITPSSFFQTNTKQCGALYDTILQLGQFGKNENVLDLYCGCGTISLYVSDYVNKVMGIELSNESIQMAHENAELNKALNCDFAAYDVKDYLSVIANETEKQFDTIILDPPRSGIHPKAAEYLLQYEPKKIVYVSCNPATQARDLALLSPKYEITAVQPVDMFPHTFHIENVVRLELK